MLSIQLSPNEILYCTSSDGKIDRVGTLGIPDGSVDGQIEALQKLFMGEEPIRQGEDTPVRLLLDTDRVCLLPTEQFRSDETATLISRQPHEQTAVSPSRADITALMALDTKLHDSLRRLFSDRIEFTHPLLLAATEPDLKKNQIEIASTRNYIHITLWNNGLHFAETIPRTPENLLFATGYLQQANPSVRFRISVTGHDAETERKRLSRYFRKTDTIRPPKIDKNVCNDKTLHYHLIHIIRSLHENH